MIDWFIWIIDKANIPYWYRMSELIRNFTFSLTEISRKFLEKIRDILCFHRKTQFEIARELHHFRFRMIYVFIRYSGKWYCVDFLSNLIWLILSNTYRVLKTSFFYFQIPVDSWKRTATPFQPISFNWFTYRRIAFCKIFLMKTWIWDLKRENELQHFPVNSKNHSSHWWIL